LIFLFQNKKRQEKVLLETTKKIKTRKSPVASPKSPTTRPQTKKKTPTSLQRKTMAKSPIKKTPSKKPMVHLKQTGKLPTKHNQNESHT